MAPVAAIPVGSGPLDRSDDGIFFFRPDGQDEGFLRHYLPAGPFDAAIVRGRLLAPHPIGSIERSNGRRGDELAWVLEENATPWIPDPDTPELARSPATELPSKRLATMPHAELYALPWTLDLLADPDAREAIARNALGVGARSFAAVAGYFEAASLTDPWLDMNLLFVKEAAKWAAGRPVCAFVQMPLAALLDGTMAAAADRYAQAGARIAMLRVSGFDPDQCTVEHARAYVDCVRTWRGVGIAPVADQTGSFGAVLVRAGAWAYSGGARYYRRVTPRPAEGEVRRRAPTVRLEVVGEWRSLTTRQARARARLPGCPDDDCEPLAEDDQPGRLKAHYIHESVRKARSAAAESDEEMIRQLRAAPGGQSKVWAAALADAEEQASQQP